MIKNLFLITLMFAASIVNAQRGTVEGKIISQNNNPISSVNITVTDTNKGAITNRFGEFKIRNIKSGTYNLSITYIGYKPKFTSFTILRTAKS